MSLNSCNQETIKKTTDCPKLVDRTVRVSNITHGLPLRRPHLKVEVLSQVNSSIQSKISEMKSSVEEFNTCSNNIGDFHIKKPIKTESEPIKNSESSISAFSRTISKETMKKEFFSLGPKSLDIANQNTIVVNGIKNQDEMELADESHDKAIVKFLQEKLFAECQFKFIGNNKVCFDHPVGVAELKSKEVIVADTFANRILLFSKEGEFIREIGRSSNLIHPSAVVVLSDGRFAVRSNREITIFSPNCTLLKSFGSEFLKKPFGITEDGQGNLITVETGLCDIMSIVFVDATTGNMVKKIPILNAAKPDEQHASKPRFITFRPPSTLLVVDLGLDKVYIISTKTGRVIKSFGSSGVSNGEFRDPSGIACEADGFILVGDSRNHRIQIFTPTGEFVCVLRLDRPLRRPSGICLTPDGNLFVLNYWENSLVKYKFCSQD